MAFYDYAALDENNIVFDIVNMDILDDIPPPYPEVIYVKCGEGSPYPLAEIGDLWTGDGFIKP